MPPTKRKNTDTHDFRPNKKSVEKLLKIFRNREVDMPNGYADKTYEQPTDLTKSTETRYMYNIQNDPSASLSVRNTVTPLKGYLKGAAARLIDQIPFHNTRVPQLNFGFNIAAILQKRKDQREAMYQYPDSLLQLHEQHDPMKNMSKMVDVRNTEMEEYRPLNSSGVLPTELRDFRYSVPDKNPDDGGPEPDDGGPEPDYGGPEPDYGGPEPYVDLSAEEQGQDQEQQEEKNQRDPIDDEEVPMSHLDTYLVDLLVEKLEARLTNNNADLVHMSSEPEDLPQPTETTEAEIKTTFFSLFEASIKGLKTRLYWSAVVDHLVDGGFSGSFYIKEKKKKSASHSR
ncbi:unnamed protein product [Ambrosiozyma monospora]|uniref:Unnamed protein product n=1 Tax=Ambrosiozyma monospora TaxID=43982 RepID=A0A9W6SUM6_AMBMO|nr:unnamed protein product [Ambrosiozyma monospora]